MLKIGQELVDAMVAHARADHPDEACGIIAGPEGSDRPERHVPMLNAERSPTFYRFDSAEQLRVWRGMDDAEATYAARELWQTINLPNLVENILPTRVRASLVLRKDYDHTVQRVRMRKL